MELADEEGTKNPESTADGDTTTTDTADTDSTKGALVDLDEWMFYDTSDIVTAKKEGRNAKTLGPVSLKDVSTLLEAGLLKLDSTIWRIEATDEKKDLKEWEPLKELTNARKVAETERWYYEDEYRKVRGPISIGELLFKYTEGQLSSKTLVRRAGTAGFKSISEAEKEKLFEGVNLDEFLEVDSWFYEDDNGDEQGPLTAKVVLTFHTTGVLTGESKIRRDDMAETRVLSSCLVMLRKHVEAHEEKPLEEDEKFFYEDQYRKIVGPVAFDMILELEKEGVLDPRSKVKKHTNMVEWMCLMDAKLFFMTTNSRRRIKKRKRKNKLSKWKNVRTQNNLYISGLPLDITEDEIHREFKKCGIIKLDLDGNPRIKLYKDEQKNKKGDGLVTYLQEGSVSLAVKLMDDLEIRNHKIHCQPAKFELKGKFDPNKRRKLSKQEKKVLRQLNNQKGSLLSWDDDENKIAPQLRIVVMKHIFTLDEIKSSNISPAAFYEKLEDEVGHEAQRVGGPIEKLTVFQGNPQGVVAVKYKKPIGAKKCIEIMHGRWFSGRQVICEYWDGVTNYKVQETEEQQIEREQKFKEFLNAGSK